MSFFTNKKPSVGLYILVWIFAFIPANAIIFLVDNYTIEMVMKNFDLDNNQSALQSVMNTYAIISTITQAPIAIAIIVFIYRKFPNLKMSKVMPWIYVLSAASFSRTFMETKEVFEPLNVDLTIFNIGLILTYIAQVLGVRYFFIKSKQW
jgi:hypothetical protein